MSHLFYLYLNRGSYRICVICNNKGAQVAFVLFVIIRGIKSHLCYLQ
jgi:hypothetical protein